MPDPKPITTVVLKNRSGQPIIIKRAQSGAEHLLEPFSAIGLKVMKHDSFLSIDWENRTIWMDLGSED